jgi:NAD(P)-dependent dehydrogenase (short-subunit alcohol dehydrogenase family)
MDFALQGQRVLVTGGASGIGRAIAEAFGRCGAHVVFTYFSSEEAAAQTVTAIEASGGKALALYADLTREAEVAPEGRQATVNRTPLHREGQPEDVAGIALFLASPHASFIAGEMIEVNGGQGIF